jgi:hypothetical protein
MVAAPLPVQGRYEHQLNDERCSGAAARCRRP